MFGHNTITTIATEVLVSIYQRESYSRLLSDGRMLGSVNLIICYQAFIWSGKRWS